MNVIDFNAAQRAAENIESKAVRDLTTQVIPVAAAAVSAILDSATTAGQKTLGDFVGALDALKTETLGQMGDFLDGWTLRLGRPPQK